ncbi:RNA polymerase sigma factor [Arthrobacter sp. ZGTC412]|uniref:RNA polymerase sigma factor n=1 Tax=Arthrobacter sp. ZGTC412 TaxID=2058900 RepID=UPI000CE414A8|nr:RNA polymerase sigma factor [Arthrobacter sp. ZGTC412]
MNDHSLEPDLDEGSVVARAQDGDLSAFEHLVNTYQGRLFRLAYRMLKDRGDAEDIVQETLTISWRRLPMLTDVNAFGGWIYRLATNKCLDLLRKRSSHAADITDPEDIHAASETESLRPPAGIDPAHEAEWSAEQEGLTAVLDTLPPMQRACWLLREMHDRSYTEIGATLKMSPTAVRGTLARARHHIAEGMSQWR